MRGDVVERVRPLRMARELRDLPGRQVREDRARELLALGAQLADLLLDVDRPSDVDVAELLELGLKLGDRLLKIEETDGHG